MAAVTWPYADVRIPFASYRSGADAAASVERTEFEDGLARQAERSADPMLVRTFTVECSNARIADVRRWFRTHSNAWFNWRDPDDRAWREARFRGGGKAVEFSGTERRGPDGELVWTAQVTLEGRMAAIEAPAG